MSRRTLATLLVLATAPLLIGAPVRAGAATESVIRVATIGDFDANGVDNGQWIDAVRARFAAVNRRGGLIDMYGTRHEVEVMPCNAASDPELTTRCARQAVDGGVVAVVGLSAVYADRALPILADAEIPAIGVRVNGNADAASPAAFPLASGLVGELMAMPQALAGSGARRIAVVISDFGPATDDALAILEAGRRLTNATWGPIVRVAPGTIDYAAAVTAATEPDVSGIIGLLGGGPAGELVRALRFSQYTGRYVTAAPWGNAPAASDPDPSLDDTLVVGQFPPPTSGDAGWRQFRRDVRAYEEDVSFNEGTLNAWLAARVFQQVLRKVDPARLKDAVLEPIVYSRDVDTGGFTPPLSSAATVSGFPRMFNRAVTFSVTQDGDLRLADPRFFDPFTGRFLSMAVSPNRRTR